MEASTTHMEQKCGNFNNSIALEKYYGGFKLFGGSFCILYFWDMFFGIRTVLFWGVRKLNKIDQRDISLILVFWGIFWDFGFFGDVFWNQTGHILGVRKLKKIYWRPLSLINPLSY